MDGGRSSVFVCWSPEAWRWISTSAIFGPKFHALDAEDGILCKVKAKTLETIRYVTLLTFFPLLGFWLLLLLQNHYRLKFLARPRPRTLLSPKIRATPDKKLWEQDTEFENDQKSREKNRENFFYIQGEKLHSFWRDCFHRKFRNSVLINNLNFRTKNQLENLQMQFWSILAWKFNEFNS